MGLAMILAIFGALVAGAIAVGPRCHVYAGIEPVCIGTSGKVGAAAVALVLVAVAIYAMTTRRRRTRATDELARRRPGAAAPLVLLALAVTPLGVAVAVSPNARTWLASVITAAVVGACLVAIAHFGIDRDSPAQYGVAGDGFTTTAVFPDKLVHALAAYALTLTFALYLPTAAAVVLVLAAGVGLEFAQGHVSYFDILADAIGAAAAVGMLAVLT